MGAGDDHGVKCTPCVMETVVTCTNCDRTTPKIVLVDGCDHWLCKRCISNQDKMRCQDCGKDWKSEKVSFTLLDGSVLTAETYAEGRYLGNKCAGNMRWGQTQYDFPVWINHGRITNVRPGQIDELRKRFPIFKERNVPAYTKKMLARMCKNNFTDALLTVPAGEGTFFILIDRETRTFSTGCRYNVMYISEKLGRRYLNYSPLGVSMEMGRMMRSYNVWPNALMHCFLAMIQDITPSLPTAKLEEFMTEEERAKLKAAHGPSEKDTLYGVMAKDITHALSELLK